MRRTQAVFHGDRILFVVLVSSEMMREQDRDLFVANSAPIWE